VASRLPVSEPVLTLRGPGGMVTVLEDWRSAMQEARGWGQPAVRGTIEQRVRAAARGLGLNLEWIAASWSAAGDLAAEVRELESRALALLDPNAAADRPLLMGICTATLHGAPCWGRVQRRRLGGVPTCEWCRTPYPPSTWVRLRAAQTREVVETDAPDEIRAHV
jgi:hypothetical protein